MKNVKKNKSGKITSFTISRKTWLRGLGQGLSALLYTKDCFNGYRPVEIEKICLNKMCCLGRAAIVCGIPKKHIATVDVPQAIETNASRKKMEKGFPWLFAPFDSYLHSMSKECALAMNINDNKDISDGDRESKLKKLFKANGCVVKFVQ